MRSFSRKIILCFLFAMLISAVFAVSALADFSGIDGSTSWTLDMSEGVLQIDGGAMSTYSAQRAPWYEYKSSIKAIEVASGVTVSKGAFYGLENLKSLTVGNVPGGYIAYAFGGDDYYNQSEYVPASLEFVELTGSGTVESYAFNHCPSIKTVIISDSFTAVETLAFKDCHALTRVTLGNNVRSIGADAFLRCDELKYVFFNGTSTLWLNVNDSCSLSPIFLQDGALSVTTLPAKTVYDLCQTLNISGMTVKIGSVDYTAAAEVIAPDMTTVGTKAVTVRMGCDETTFNITVKGTITSGVSGVITWALNNGALTLTGSGMMDNYTLEITPEWYAYRDSITSVSIGSGITSIGSYAFYGLEKVTAITVPATVENIGYGAFKNCEKLVTLDIQNTNAVVDGSAFNGCTSLMTASAGTSYYTVSGNANYAVARVTSTSFVIPATTKVIADGAFEGLGITSISIPDSVITIGANAFESTSLTTVTVGTGIKRVGDYAFVDSTALNTVTFNAVPDFIGSGAFAGTGITSQYLAAAGNSYAILLNADSEAASFNINSATKLVASLAFANNTKLEGVMLPTGLAGIGDSAFNGCTALKSVTIPDTVKTIGDNAFKGCSALVSVALGSGVETIGNSAFRGTAISEIIIPDSVENVGFNSFRDCASLATLVYNAKCGIGYKTFANCTSLDDIYLSDTVLSIGDYAFMNCTALKAIAIPDTTGYIGNGALYGADSVKKISLPFIGEKAGGENTLLSYIFGNTGVTRLDTVLVGSAISANAFTGISVTNVIVDESVTSVNASALNGKTVYYLGSAEGWSALCPTVTPAAFGNSTFKLESTVKEYFVGDVLDRVNFKATIGELDVTDILRFVSNPITSDESHLPAKLGSAQAKFRAERLVDFKFANYSLLLEGTIGIKYYIEFDPETELSEIQASTVSVLFKDKTYTLELEKANNTANGKTYVTTFYVAAKEMNDDVTITVTTPNHSDSFTTNVANYVKYVNDNSEQYADCLEIVNEMYNYGEYSRHYFTKEDITPNPDLTDVAITVSNAYKPTRTGSVTGVSLKASSLILESSTLIRHYFNFDTGVDPYSFTYKVSGQAVQLQHNSGGYYVEIDNIIARALGTNYGVVVTKGSETMSISYSAMSYVKIVLEDPTSDADLINLSKALYRYYFAAAKYFSTTPEGTINPDENESKPSIW